MDVCSSADSQKIKSRNDPQKFADFENLARKFLEASHDSSSSKQIVPTQAYVEEVVESIRRGENKECPICLEFADDPVLTPCAHKMCRECLLSSWQTPATGRCPICRQWLANSDLITCPSESRFQVTDEENWTESSKVAKLLDFLERILRSGSGAKSIVFSQWTTFLDLLESPMKKRGIGFLRFDGKLSQTQRERVLNEFNDTRGKMVSCKSHVLFLSCYNLAAIHSSLTFCKCVANTQVLLTSLKTGGVGLNLTAASNVFIMVLPNLYIYNLHVSGKLILSSLVSKTSPCSFFSGSVVESCCRGASDNENSSHWPKANCCSQKIYCQGDLSVVYKFVLLESEWSFSFSELNKQLLLCWLSLI